jgi:putative inorganic carbon (HCO3(-)) transporter
LAVNRRLKDTHSWYIKVLVETGIFGLVFAFLLLQQMLALGYRLFRRTSNPLCRELGLGLFLAVVSCAVANFFGDRWTYLEITGQLWVVVGAAVRAKELESSEETTASDEVDPSLAMMPQGA